MQNRFLLNFFQIKIILALQGHQFVVSDVNHKFCSVKPAESTEKKSVCIYLE